MIIITYFLLFSIVNLDAVSIPSIQNIFLKPLSGMNFTNSMYLNKTCSQCLCDFLNLINNTVYIALNCFTNNTCQFFQTFPVIYKLEAFSGAKLYFLQSIFPNSSKCCMPNITDLLNLLQNATPIIANLSFMPSAFGYDENIPNEIAIVGRLGAYVYWFDAFNLTFLRSHWIQNTSLSVALRNNSIYTAVDQVSGINVYNTQTNNLTVNINNSILFSLRKYIFINNDQNMVVTAQTNKSLVIFNINSPTNYTFQVNN
jgi:hypothetical protein